MRPDHGAVILALSAIMAAATTVLLLLLVAGPVVAQIPLVARLGGWAPQRLRAVDDVPTWLGTACLLVAVASILAGARRLALELAALARARRLVRGSPTRLVVLDDPAVGAFAVPVRPGRIVVSAGLLRRLDPAERRALLAHETSHLDHHHGALAAAGRVAAAMNPLLSAVAQVAAHACERWADEDAAAAVGDRTVAARAVAVAALHGSRGSGLPVGGVAAAGGRVTQRVTALLATPPRQRLAPVFSLIVMMCFMAAAPVVQANDTDAVLDAGGTAASPH